MFSFTGILFGYLLSLIAPEELGVGEKHFIFARRAILFFSFIFIGFFLFNLKFISLVYLTSLIFLACLISFFEFSKKIFLTNTLAYLFFIITFFLIDKTELNLVLTSFTFLYGFPIGLLLSSNINQK